MQHDLRCWPAPFDMTVRGKKKAELRTADPDRPFADGDVLHLMRYDPEAEVFTGECLLAKVWGVYAGPHMPEGTVLLSHGEPLVWTGGCGACRENRPEADDA